MCADARLAATPLRPLILVKKGVKRGGFETDGFEAAGASI